MKNNKNTLKILIYFNLKINNKKKLKICKMKVLRTNNKYLL